MNNVKQPLVSVIIPTYNRLHTLSRSMDSVLNQTYKNVEIIIMDDGSTDGTEEYIRGIRDKRVKYMKSNINRGPSAARNRGVELAEGEYLAFQDSDDEWMPDKLEKQMAFLLGNEDISMVYSEFGVYMEGQFVTYVPSREVSYEQKSGDIFSHLLLYPLIGTPTIVIKTRDFLREGGFDEGLKAYEDYEFSLRFARKNKIGFIGEELLKVNASRDSVNRRSDERIRTQFFMVREMLEPLREWNLLEKKLEIILREAENRSCYDIFIEEAESLSRSALSHSEYQCVLRYLDKARKDKEIFFTGVRVKMQAGMPGLKASILKVYAELYENKTLWSADQQKSIQDVIDKMCDCEKVFDISEETRNLRTQIQVRMGGEIPEWTDLLYLLADLAEALEMLEKDMMTGDIKR